MPGFDDDDEYESFDLEDAAAQAAQAARAARAAEVGPVVVDSDDDDDDDEDDEPEDATDDEIDYVLAAHREDGQLHVEELDSELANDLDELIVQLRRRPGDAGALGFVSLVEEVFVIVRVRGQHVQVMLSDSAAASDWPIARDVVDLLNEDLPEDEDDDEGEPVGDLGMLADLGLSEFDLLAILDDLDLTSDQMLQAIAERIALNPDFARLAEAAFDDD
jgi:putative tRNA adenosine deaminase-associated protein